MKVTVLKKKILMILSYILVAAAASVWTLLLNAPEKPEYSKLAQLEELIQDKYIDEVHTEAIEDAAAAAMVENLGDRWSYYIPAREYAAYVEKMENAYVGIGITIILAEDGTGVEVVAVDENGSADLAGMEVGDVIVAVDGTRIAGMDTSTIRDMVRGAEGTRVEITVRRAGEELLLPMTRAYVQTPVATAQLLEDGIGLVTIKNFDTRCTEETLEAIESLLDQGAEKLIFDVRNNPASW